MSPYLKVEPGLKNWVDEENIHVSLFSGQKVLQSRTSNKDNPYEKEALPTEQTTSSGGDEDVEVNITGGAKSSEALIMRDSYDDVTESFSSFSDSGSSTENTLLFSDDEVVSHIYANNPFSSMFYQYCEPSLKRRKKLTSHWKSFIRPLRWRCKWIELQLKKLRSQELKYEKEIAAYDYRRQIMSANFASDGIDTKLAPLTGGICGKKVMKRKKRKRVEETCNLASYTSDHRVLSYYEEKYSASHAPLKKANSCLNNVKGVVEARNPESNEEIKCNDDIFSHLENDLLSSIDHNDTDKFLVSFFEKIEAAQSEVLNLKTRIDKIVSENQEKSNHVNNLNMLRPSDDLNLYNPNSSSPDRIKNTFSARNQFMEKTKESVKVRKSVSPPDFVAKNNSVPNLLSNNLKFWSASKSNVSGKKRGMRKKSGSNWWTGSSLVKPNLKR
ncbi:uncharacterized protein LOC129285240 [Prosopis cineraria]|uniref:uncharacterized protein LOC129285240 n=1 Tax=Prosopis cineraria TaxID=364024 RepID=UPI00240EFC2B|nr:uncharacterized protein LOC129285240 [Prosopis cineraria]